MVGNDPNSIDAQGGPARLFVVAVDLASHRAVCLAPDVVNPLSQPLWADAACSRWTG
jgi:hypothetical protein